MLTRTSRGRLKGLLTYVAAVIIVLGAHAVALQMDSAGPQEPTQPRADKTV